MNFVFICLLKFENNLYEKGEGYFDLNCEIIECVEKLLFLIDERCLYCFFFLLMEWV